MRWNKPEEHAQFVRNLCREIAFYDGYPLRFDTVYFGGGTPSILDPHRLGEIIETARQHLNVSDGARLTLEVNPEDVHAANIRAWRDLGFRTVSLGVQSFRREELRLLGRRHKADQARRCVERTQAAGFDTVSVDLIYGIPRQALESWRQNIDTLIGLGVDHVSCYQLTFHESTPYWRGKEKGVLEEQTDEAQADFFETTHRMLEDAGFEGYEVSNFAREPRHRSQHNQTYWDHTPYLGLGPSAHSFRDDRRWWNERELEAYTARIATGARPVAGSEILESTDLALEAVMLRLRTKEGIDLEAFRARYGIDLLDKNRPLIERYVDSAVARLEAGYLRLTLKGLAIVDAVAREIEVGGAD